LQPLFTPAVNKGNAAGGFETNGGVKMPESGGAFVKKYGIFDSRPKHSGKPFLFTVGWGRYDPAVFDSKEEAEKMAAKMNATTILTTYVVKEV
jgi:hypothetical protein